MKKDVEEKSNISINNVFRLQLRNKKFTKIGRYLISSFSDIFFFLSESKYIHGNIFKLPAV